MGGWGERGTEGQGGRARTNGRMDEGGGRCGRAGRGARGGAFGRGVIFVCCGLSPRLGGDTRGGAPPYGRPGRFVVGGPRLGGDRRRLAVCVSCLRGGVVRGVGLRVRRGLGF